MTKPLSDQEKKRRKADRRKSKQQKAKSATVKTVTQPKPEEPDLSVNLCDDCAYEFGQCEGAPVFASHLDESLTGADADRVVKCPSFFPVADMPTSDSPPPQEAAAGPGAAATEPEPVHAIEKEGATEEDKAEDLAVMKKDLTDPDVLAERRARVARLANDDEDLGKCPSCQRPLKRTAYNRQVDAVRCTNPRCRAYRSIVKTLTAKGS